jgi:ABC-type Fe3+ transport system substrate-binding protein
MRRYLPLILFFLVLLTPFALKQIYGTQTDTLAQQGAKRLVVITPHVEGIRREFAEAFVAYYLEKFGEQVYVDYRSIGGTNEIIKQFDAMSRTPNFQQEQTFNVDLCWGGGDTAFEEQFKRSGYLEPVTLPAKVMQYAFPESTLAGVNLYDVKDRTWYGTALSSFGITYNADVMKGLGKKPPGTWSELADPKLRGWVVLADPTRSSSVKKAFMIIVERSIADLTEGADAADFSAAENAGWARGMGLIRQIAANARMFTDAGSSVPGFIASGDAAAGMTIDFFGRSQADAIPDNRLVYVDPPNATAINPDPIALVKGAPHKELAIRFIEFVLSERGQRLWNTRAGAPGGPRQTALRRLPIAPGLYRDLTHFTDPVDVFRAAGTFNSQRSRTRTWGIIDVLIEVSCMDLLEDLRETRKVILAAGRDDLDQKLGIFPFDQDEALRRANQWKNAKPIERIELQRQWRAEFRDEYRTLREAALSGGGKR